ncbi:hypothetical protein BJ878DRAFT_179562 [Calycina marina]|uniref:Uncharacterized protein n=1 Tax=Calycina marina TaxID=1763456 RepID=A0A9P8CD17_9HELO|nr:hypothetical protein BJ878DRAFT_179562 [Calycina marina]
MAIQLPHDAAQTQERRGFLRLELTSASASASPLRLSLVNAASESSVFFKMGLAFMIFCIRRRTIASYRLYIPDAGPPISLPGPWSDSTSSGSPAPWQTTWHFPPSHTCSFCSTPSFIIYCLFRRSLPASRQLLLLLRLISVALNHVYYLLGEVCVVLVLLHHLFVVIKRFLPVSGLIPIFFCFMSSTPAF